jgi:hypothetical protein
VRTVPRDGCHGRQGAGLPRQGPRLDLASALVRRDRAFRESPNIAGEVELREKVEEVGTDVAKDRQSADVGDFVPGKVDVFEEVQSLFETSGDEIVAMRWQVTNSSKAARAST